MSELGKSRRFVPIVSASDDQTLSILISASEAVPLADGWRGHRDKSIYSRGDRRKPTSDYTDRTIRCRRFVETGGGRERRLVSGQILSDELIQASRSFSSNGLLR